MAAQQPTRVVYVGSIPYDQTEEQLLDIFQSVGNVAHIRLVLDRDTGKSKGFAFVEYHDVETAASAVRNLNNYKIGNRILRVDYSSNESIGPVDGMSGEKASDWLLPSLPKGRNVPAGQSAAEMITHKLQQFDKDRVLQIVTDLKSMANNNAAQVQQLFMECPQLAYAAVQSMLMLGIVDANTVSGIVENNASEQYDPSAPTAQVPEQKPEATTAVTQAQLIQQVMHLTEEQISELPAEQQNQIRDLRQRVASGEITF